MKLEKLTDMRTGKEYPQKEVDDLNQMLDELVAELKQKMEQEQEGTE